MKRMKQMAVLAVAAAVILAGCENSFSGNTLDTAPLAAYNNAANVTNITDPVISGVGTNGVAAITATTKQQITVAFIKADAIDEGTIASAVTINKLADPTVATDSWKQTAVTPSAVVIRDESVLFGLTLKAARVAYFTVDLTGSADQVEVIVDATKLTARNGALKLDRDGDEVQGEKDDDDYYSYVPITGVTPITLTGVGTRERDPQANLFAGAGSFTLAPGASTFQITTNLVVTEDLTNLFKGNIVIQSYDVTKDLWSDVTTVLTNPSNNNYSFAFTAVVGTSYRMVAKDFQALKSTKENYGFIRKATTKATLKTYTGKVADGTYASLAALNQSIGNPFSLGTVYSDALGKNVYLDLTIGAAVMAASGLDVSTITTSNIMLFDQSTQSFIPVASIKSLIKNADIGSTATVADTVRITLPANYVKQTHNCALYIGPALKTGNGVTNYGNVNQNSNKPYGFSIFSNFVQL